ncbi:hypothetical protein MPSEU_000726200 [Mayamaea pseudoterrestris]|nr:hypothetical protein MPSEU_000726200 [Mayamaea pseudoterrestris]
MRRIQKDTEEVKETLDDDGYAKALLEELQQLAQDLLQARTKRDDSREMKQSLEAELSSLMIQLQQRKHRNDLLEETDLLKKKVDARKREKAHLMKQLASMRRECRRLQDAAGLETQGSPFHAKDCVERKNTNESEIVECGDDAIGHSVFPHGRENDAAGTDEKVIKTRANSVPQTAENGMPR